MEQRQAINGFDGLYEITTNGRVYSVRRGKYLKPRIDRYGYERVVLSVGNKQYHRTIHRLVAETYIPNPYGKPTVNHLNEEKTDNRVENLEWVTVSENDNYGSRNARMALSKCHSPVKQRIGRGWRWFVGVKDAARQTGICHSQIAKCCHGKTKTAGGYEWRYVYERH